jgi:hypothetical protein
MDQREGKRRGGGEEKVGKAREGRGRGQRSCAPQACRSPARAEQRTLKTLKKENEMKGAGVESFERR